MSKSAEGGWRNIKLTLAYDGTRYLGWQKTRMGASIEESLELVLARILQHPVKLQAAGRTDAGVHAAGQVANFFTSSKTPLDVLRHSLNGLLPDDIAVLSVEEASSAFHPTLDSKGKEYRYHLCYGRIQLPHERWYAWHSPYPLDIEAMKKAALLLAGRRDFSAFCNVLKNRTYAHAVRDVESIEVHLLPGERLRVDVKGNHFLYKMVRNLVGTLAYVGRGKIGLGDLEEIALGGDRTRAGVTAPACGLFLHRVFF